MVKAANIESFKKVLSRKGEVVKLDDYRETSKLEEDFVKYYGEALVSDLKRAYKAMLRDMRDEPSNNKVKWQRRHISYGSYKTVYFVNFTTEKLYGLTVDDEGNRSLVWYRNSGILKAFNDDKSLRLLLGGMMLYDRDAAKRWCDELLDGARPAYGTR
jgi:hypothetical protein